MRYYKITGEGFIYSIGVGDGGEEISEEEYNTIQTAIANKPEATETTDYMLRTDLTWDAYDVEPVDPEIDEAEAFEIIFGGEE